jgi:RNA polymerase sigma-70 factor (ECF subfamily)
MTGRRGVERADGISDEQLVAQAQAELPYNTSSFEALVRAHEPRVFEACARYLGNEQDAEEVSQDIFVRVFHGLPEFEGRASFRTWLFSVVRNECASRYRKRKRADEQRAAISAQMLEERDTAVLALEPQQEWTGPVGEAVGRLSEQDREVLILRHVGELSFQEIAKALGLGLSATKMRLYRAEERFRLEYDQAARSRAV